MPISAHRKYEDELMVKAAISGIMAFPGGFIVAVLVNPVLGLAMIFWGGKTFKKIINTPNPHA